MAFENILETIFPGMRSSTAKLRELIPAAEKNDPLAENGLHMSDPDRYAGCPILVNREDPVKLAEGFREGRYVSSAVFSGNSRSLVTSLKESLPPFTCRVVHGVPRIIKSPVTLPLEILARGGSFDLASDGVSVFLVRKIGRRGSALRAQLSDLILLEELTEILTK